MGWYVKVQKPGFRWVVYSGPHAFKRDAERNCRFAKSLKPQNSYRVSKGRGS